MMQIQDMVVGIVCNLNKDSPAAKSTIPISTVNCLSVKTVKTGVVVPVELLVTKSPTVKGIPGFSKITSPVTES